MKKIIVFKTALGQYGSVIDSNSGELMVERIVNDGGKIVGEYPFWEDAC